MAIPRKTTSETRRQPGRRHTAIHEAGHAVIGRVLDLPCGLVTIAPDPDGGWGGMARIGGPDETCDWWWNHLIKLHRSEDVALRAQALCSLAGAAAEEECLGFCAGGDGRDLLDAADMLRPLVPEDDVPRYAARLRARLRPIVRRHRATIELVAAQLLAQTTLSGEEVDQLAGLKPAG